MKLTKKLLSMLIALTMVFTLAIPAFAAMEGELTGGSITINDAVSGQTYNAYQILYLESYNKDAGTYAYKANPAWATWLATQKDYVEIDAQGYVTWKDGADVAAFAKLAQAQLSGKDADRTATASNTTVTLSGLKLGYYLVDTTLGTLCSLDTTNPDVVMEEKNEVPEIKKEVEEDSSKVWGATNDADINQVVNFKATVTVQKGAENYTVHDKMSAGLTYNNDVTVKVNNTVVPSTNNYTLTENAGDGCTFEVKFDNTYIAGLAVGTQIVIEYSATLNEGAEVGNAGNPNEVKLQYGDENKPSYTPKSETITYTWDAKVIKYTTKDGIEVKLAGAKFKLSTDEDGENVLKFHKLATANEYEHCVDATCDKGHETEITTDETGTFHIEGLDAGTYYLTETKAPDGYNKLEKATTITITPTKTENDKMEYATGETKVENKSGTVLPSTGGIGTTLFYGVGGAMFLGSLIMLVTKKRMKD